VSLHSASLFTVAAGILLVGWLPGLPLSVPVSLLLIVSLIAVLILLRRMRRFPGFSGVIIAVFFSIGLGLGCFSGHKLVANQLPDEWAGKTIRLTGVVSDLPQMSARSLRFELTVSGVSNEQYQWLAGRRIRLGWFSGRNKTANTLKPGDNWQLDVRLRRPRGFVNPHGFDYQRWLLSQHIAATGYVRASKSNKRLGDGQGSLLNYWRFAIRESISNLNLAADSRALVTALTLGDHSQLDSDIWQLLASAGVVHLLVISGLHIGLAALLGFYVGGGVGRVAGLLWRASIARYWGCAGSVGCAMGYAALSGFNLPAQRALVMVLVANAMLLLNRQGSRGYGFCLALLVVALIDQLATHSAGFWLSFSAVAVLLWLMPVHNGPMKPVDSLRLFLRAQVLVFVGLTLILGIWQLPQPLLSPLVNLLAIPWVSFLMVPLCLLGVLIYPVSESLSQQLWMLAGEQLSWFLLLLDRLPIIALPFGLRSPVLLAGGVFAVLLLLLPVVKPVRYLSAVLLLAIVASATGTSFIEADDTQSAPLSIAVLDVGQGLGVVVQTRTHTLVYDTGPAYSERFNAGSGIIVPYLRGEGVSQVDVLMISHGDSDHAGGVSGFLTHFKPRQIISGFDLDGSKRCRAGQQWQWDDVSFRVLHPATGAAVSRSNNQSCVLLISNGDHHVLLPGDIERDVEAGLVDELLRMTNGAPVSLVVAPHHGSKTSSSSGFVGALQPRHVVFSAGYRHHFGHPHPRVVQRYQTAGAILWRTGDSGAVIFHWRDNASAEVTTGRQLGKRYWFDGNGG
jgi:competence protein ComEC